MSTATESPLDEKRRRLLTTIAVTLASAAVPLPISAFVGGSGADRPTIDLLAEVAYTLFPSDFVTAAQRINSAKQLLVKINDNPALLTEVNALLAALPDDFADLDQPTREAALVATDNGAALMALRGAAVNAIYRDPEVWKAIGYPGPSAPFGGYINRGLVDIDWLAEVKT